MDFSNHIKFEGNLIKGHPIKVTYSGYLFEKGSDSVSIVYGFGSHWEHTSEVEMEKTEAGFTTKINMLDYALFNCCFKSSGNEWDNNYGGNYVFEIEEEIIDSAFILNENVICDILENLFEIDISKIEAKQEKTTPIVEATIEPVAETPAIEEFEIAIEKNEAVSIEDSLVTSIDVAALNRDIEQLFNEIYQSKEDTIVEEVSEKQSLLSDILADKATPQEIVEEKEETSSFNMNSLIDEILSPIISSASFETEELGEEYDSLQTTEETAKADEIIDNLVSEIKQEVEEKTEVSYIETGVEEVETPVSVEPTSEIEEEFVTDFSDDEVSLIETLANEAREEMASKSAEGTTALIEVKQEDSFLVSARSLGKFYMFKKRIKLAFYKLFSTLPKLLASTLFEENNK